MTGSGSARPRSRVKYFVAGALAVVVLVVALQNMEEIETQILFVEIRMRLFFLILTAFGTGMLVGWLMRRRRKG